MNSIERFISSTKNEILGTMVINGRQEFTLEQQIAWEVQIDSLQYILNQISGQIFFEFSIPRMGKRVDCILIHRNIVFVLEFKVGQNKINHADLEQVWDYALDLKNFHKPSHEIFLVPILIATNVQTHKFRKEFHVYSDNLFKPIQSNSDELLGILKDVISKYSTDEIINPINYIGGSYEPTPTIIEAAISLFNNHNVQEITRSDSDEVKLSETTKYIAKLIQEAKDKSKKIICFVTGVPGAGKTLAGLKVAIEHLDKKEGNSSVFLSGNKPLVDVLQEALTRDKVSSERRKGIRITKKEAKQSVKSFIQIIHHYRDEYIRNSEAPYDHIAIFDEAQRAWNKEQTIKFMQTKKGIKDFNRSEPEFLIECIDRHNNWGVVICLVGGGQEINTGEGGISEWLKAIKNHFTNWDVHISDRLYDSEYSCEKDILSLLNEQRLFFNGNMHLGVSLRSFRAEYLSLFVKQLLDLNPEAKNTYKLIHDKYPICITRNLDQAKSWLKINARGSERYGMVVSSQAYRLKPLAIDIKTPMNHVNWFLDGKEDIRSSYFLEEVATEFQVQGLELDWVCLTWDADFRHSSNGWETYSFKGSKWQNINKTERKKYLLNAYRVLLTRARHGMVIVVPIGDENDNTRLPSFYNSTFEYLKSLGLHEI
ncbi:MAG: DUF2075 domain-containing protein [Flavobacteriales bacterium]|jgi:hypothetical protein